MAVRLNTTGGADLKDHKQLANIGVNTHDTIDLYLQEIDNARGNSLDLGERLSSIEDKDVEQDDRLDAIDLALGDITTDITDLVDEVVALTTAVDDLGTDITAVDGKVDDLGLEVADNTSNITDLTDRVTLLESKPSGGAETSQEVIDARVDKDGIVYSNLKARLDATQGVGGTGGTVYSKYFIEHFDIGVISQSTFMLTKGAYTPGTNELELFVNGIRKKCNEDYFEVNGTQLDVLLPLSEKDVVTARVRDRSNQLYPNTIISEVINVVGGLQNYTLLNAFNNSNRFLEVYLMGQLLIEGRDYVKTGNLSIRLLDLASDGDLLLCQIIDTTDKGTVKQLIEHQGATEGVTLYNISTFQLSTTDSTLEVYLDGIHLSRGRDYSVVSDNLVSISISLFTGSNLMFCIENTGNRAVSVSEFNVVANKVSTMESTISSSMLTRFSLEFTTSDWVEDLIFNDFRINISKAIHGKQDKFMTISTYEDDNGIFQQVNCAVSINSSLGIVIRSTQPFIGYVIVI